MKIILTKKGFTLVEMIVSLAIFSIVALISVSALIKVMDANQKSISLKTSINNLNFALEAMTREMRMGNEYKCDTALPSGNSGNIISGGTISAASCTDNENWMIAFKSSKRNLNNTCNLVFAYKYIDQTIYKAEQSSDVQNCNVLNNSSFYPIISADMKITKSVVNVDSATPNKQPIIRIYIDGESGAKVRNKTQFTLQTTISQRLPI